LKGAKPKIVVEDSGDILAAALEDLLLNEVRILKAWDAVQVGRRLIDTLDQYDQVAHWAMPENAVEISIMQIEFLARINRSYALLMAEKGYWEDAVSQLGRMHSVARKALPTARYLINKLIWIKVTERNLTVAHHRLANHPGADAKALKQLRAYYPLINEAAVSYYGALISEAMFMRFTAREQNSPDELLSGICDGLWYGSPCEGWWNRSLIQVFLGLCYKPHSTENHLMDTMKILIEACRQHPLAIAQARNLLAEFQKPIFGNTAGAIMIFSPFSDYSLYIENAAKVKVLSDLLHLQLKTRLGDSQAMDPVFSKAPVGTAYRARRMILPSISSIDITGSRPASRGRADANGRLSKYTVRDNVMPARWFFFMMI
jgi:hypothetical protein